MPSRPTDETPRDRCDDRDLPEDAETYSQNPSGALAAKATPELLADAARGARTLDLWRLAWPVMLSQMLVTSVSLVDIAMVGRIGSHAQAAVGYATQFFFMTQSVLFAVGFACVALMARFIGAGEIARARAALAGSVGIALTTALVLVTAMLAAPERILQWLNAEPDVIEMTIPYLRLVLGSTLLLSVALTLESGLRADRNTVVAMRIAVFVATVKIALNWLLIFGALGMPRLELVGAGMATLVSQAVGLAAFVGVVMGRPPGSPVSLTRADFVAGRAFLRDIVRIAMPGVAERVVLNLALFVYFAFLGTYGTATVAAYTIGVRALSFTWIPGIGFAQAVGTFVGQALGRGDEAEAEATGRRAAWMSLGIAAVLGLIASVGRMPLSRVFTQDPATVAALEPFLLCLAIAQPMLQLHFTLAGVHRGAGDTWTPLVAATLGNWGLRVPLAYLFSSWLHWPILWLWMALIFDHAARAAWLLAGFRRGRWKHALAPHTAAGPLVAGVASIRR
jgi:putative MATE family efflux protein